MSELQFYFLLADKFRYHIPSLLICTYGSEYKGKSKCKQKKVSVKGCHQWPVREQSSRLWHTTELIINLLHRLWQWVSCKAGGAVLTAEGNETTLTSTNCKQQLHGRLAHRWGWCYEAGISDLIFLMNVSGKSVRGLRTRNSLIQIKYFCLNI